MARLAESARNMPWAMGLLLISQMTLLAGCATTSPKGPMLLQHPRTGHTVECHPSVQDCRAEYELQGYVKI